MPLQSKETPAAAHQSVGCLKKKEEMHPPMRGTFSVMNWRNTGDGGVWFKFWSERMTC